MPQQFTFNPLEKQTSIEEISFVFSEVHSLAQLIQGHDGNSL